ncbi:hypothetical protein D915_006265 [Fasciola hepatica]|uniref:Uncharacterized protein n=1 Tax=Fasciola hepatica TaxID=6192 RepID=A0A4E0R9B1_FASHE|nr:hypothetical protein D915_006265 [Fasciola hepatica]
MMNEPAAEGTAVSRRVQRAHPILKRLEKLAHKDGKMMKYSVAQYMASWEDYKKFVSRVDAWYNKNEKRYLRYMSLFAREYLTEAEFKLAFRDLQTPFNDLELQILYQMLDPQLTGRVEYTKLYEAIWIALAGKFISDDPIHQMDLEPPDRWVLLTFKVPSCEPFDMPTTFEHLVDLSFTGAMLRTVIQARVPSIATRAIVIFTDVAHYADTVVHCNQKLYEFNYHGGPKCAPEEGVIYYEFSMGRIDCPILTSLFPKEQQENSQEQLPPPPLTKTGRILARLDKLTKRDDRVLDKLIEERLSTWDDYERFVATIERWYNKNSKRYMLHMSQYGRDFISELEFKLVMRDLQLPLTDLEIHILYTWLDPERTGQVEYAKLFESLYKALFNRFVEDDEYHEMNLEYQKKWVKMTFKAPSCDQLDLPTTFDALIHLGFTGTMLIDLILERVPCLPSRNLVIFTDPARYAETLVHCNQKLYDFPYQGGPKCAPKEGTIYYEFSLGHIDCPLLMAVDTSGKEHLKEADNTGPADATLAMPTNPSSSG